MTVRAKYDGQHDGEVHVAEGKNVDNRRMTSASRGQPNTTTCMTVRHDAEGKIATAENDTAARDDDVQPVTAHKRTYSLLAGKTVMTRVSDDPQEDLQLWHRGKNI